jgi:hypothetical protein
MVAKEHAVGKALRYFNKTPMGLVGSSVGYANSLVGSEKGLLKYAVINLLMMSIL